MADGFDISCMARLSESGLSHKSLPFTLLCPSLSGLRHVLFGFGQRQCHAIMSPNSTTKKKASIVPVVNIKRITSVSFEKSTALFLRPYLTAKNGEPTLS